MARRIARGLFRLWVVGSVMWICTVGTVTWWMWPNLPGLTAVDDSVNGPPPFDLTQPVAPDMGKSAATKEPFDPDAYLAEKRKEDAPKAWPGTPVPDEDITWRWCRTGASFVHCRTGKATIQTAAEIALIPPKFVLALGAGLGWAFKGFQS
jgi:hypothetical protein